MVAARSDHTFMDTGNAYYSDLPYYPLQPRKSQAAFEGSWVGAKEITIRCPAKLSLHVKAAELYPADAGKVGMNVKLQLVDWSTWMSGSIAKEITS